jgi:ceroid-lipofuscinosis MFS transporter 7
MSSWAWRTLNNSFIVNGWVTFVSDAARGILFPALWPLVHHLGGGRIDQGYLVASFSVGRLLVTKVLGTYASKHGHRSALLISQYFLMVGALLWANAYLLRLPSLYLAQVLMGLGTGSLGVTRSYVSEQTASKERTSRLARLTSLQYAGFAVTPLLGSGLVELGAVWSEYWKYALPAYSVFLCALSCAISLVLCYRDIDYDEVARTRSTAPAIAPLQMTMLRPLIEGSHPSIDSGLTTLTDETWLTSSSATTTRPYVPPEMIRAGARLFVMLNFITIGAFVVYETLGSRILLDDLNLTQLEMGFIVGFSGVIGTLQLIYFKRVYTSRFSDMILILCGLLIVCAAQVLVLKYSGSHSYSRGPFGLSLFLVYAFGYPISNSGVLGSYSILQKQLQHSSAQARFAFFGSLAKIIMPISVGYIEGSVTTGSFSLVLIILSLCVLLLCYYAQPIEDITNPKIRWTVPGPGWSTYGTSTIITGSEKTPSNIIISNSNSSSNSNSNSNSNSTGGGRLTGVQVVIILLAVALVVLGILTMGINAK